MISFVAFGWMGLVLGVSFLAAPVKFRAPSLTRPVALEVGHVTFHALAWAERALLAALLAAMVTGEPSATTWTAIGLVALVMAAQQAWLLPALDRRVAAIIGGADLERSHNHTTFAVLEVAKVAALIVAGATTLG